ncbi:LysR family transcriptional regulator [Paenibacillus hamazuiensis]|uniref:LysR family transcriptional regulator n=1 Tax=Paenibacillus hamazuiensis TaxID=2936508 RepID=UPI00200E4E8C|nr:LysR family transcriptional regulator [Paenibacillus hamazuiensis]
MNEKDCVLLQYLMEEQSLTKAAERLYITQPALTYRLHQLEKEFGVPIIVKNAKGAKLTPEGEYLAAYAKKSLDDLNKMKDYITNMRNEVKGTLRLGVASYFGLYKLPPLLKKFKDHYPDVQINVTCALSPEILDQLHQEEIHVGVVRGEYSWHGAKSLLHDESICIISKEALDLERLPELPQIHYKEPKIKAASPAPSRLSETIQAWWHERYDAPPTITMQVDAYETCKEMVKHGLGYSIVPGVFVSPEDGLHTVDLIRKNGEPIKRNTWMLYQETSLSLAIVDRFVQFMKTEHTS